MGGRIELIRMFGNHFHYRFAYLRRSILLNLSTAQSDQRSKEVGIRKLSGAGRGNVDRAIPAEVHFNLRSRLTLLAIVMVRYLFHGLKIWWGRNWPTHIINPIFG